MLNIVVILSIIILLIAVWFKEVRGWVKSRVNKVAKKAVSLEQQGEMKREVSYNLNRVFIDYTARLSTSDLSGKQEPASDQPAPKGLDFLKQFEEFNNKSN